DFHVTGVQTCALPISDHSVDLAIVDVMMPGVDGFQLTARLKEEWDMPVLMLTAKGELEDKREGFMSGVDDYVVKPFEPEELLFQIGRASCRERMCDMG